MHPMFTHTYSFTRLKWPGLGRGGGKAIHFHPVIVFARFVAIAVLVTQPCPTPLQPHGL